MALADITGGEFAGMMGVCGVVAAFLYFIHAAYKSGRKDEAEATARRNDPESWEYQWDQRQKKEQRSLDRLIKMEAGQGLTPEEQEEENAEMDEMIRKHKGKESNPPPL